MSTPDLLALFAHFAMLSLLTVGGALGVSPEMYCFLVDGRGWLTAGQFTDSIALAQAAPGPNVLFVTLLGWQAGGATGALATTTGMLLPAGLLCYFGNRWRTGNLDSRIVRAIRLGVSPIAIGLTLAAGWIILVANDHNWRLGMLSAIAFAFFLFSRRNPLWLIALGAVAGALGFA